MTNIFQQQLDLQCATTSTETWVPVLHSTQPKEFVDFVENFTDLLFPCVDVEYTFLNKYDQGWYVTTYLPAIWRGPEPGLVTITWGKAISNFALDRRSILSLPKGLIFVNEKLYVDKEDALEIPLGFRTMGEVKSDQLIAMIGLAKYAYVHEQLAPAPSANSTNAVSMTALDGAELKITKVSTAETRYGTKYVVHAVDNENSPISFWANSKLTNLLATGINIVGMQIKIKKGSGKAMMFQLSEQK
jgi:hypothetical protein